MSPEEIAGLKRARHDSGAPESPASNETFPERTRRPGEVGLANEARPGLGTRREDDGVASLERTAGRTGAQDAEPRGRNAPVTPKAPRDQKSDAAREQERDTEASGQAGLK